MDDLWSKIGAFESMGAGLEMSSGDIAFKCNFATVAEDGRNGEEDDPIVVARRCDRNFEREGPQLCAILDKMHIPGFPDYEVRVKYATEHRCGVVVRGPGLSDKITGTDPLRDGLRLIKCSATDAGDSEAVHTAAIIDALSNAIRHKLKNHPLYLERKAKGKHPANVVLLRGCGKRIDAPLFSQVHNGLKGCMIAPTKIIAGIGKTLGIEVLDAEGATGDYHTQLTSKAKRAADALLTKNCCNEDYKYDFCFLHVKGIDDAGHDKICPLKIALIEKVDTMVSQLIQLLWQQQQQDGTRFVLCITGDHSTPVNFGDHSHEPVPFAVARLANVVHLLGEEYVEEIKLGPIAPVDLSSIGTANYAFSKCPMKSDLDSESLEDAEKDRETNPENCKLANDSVGIDAVRVFSEEAASRGSLGRFPGQEIMPLLLKMRKEYSAALVD